jgi:hypothetical protein
MDFARACNRQITIMHVAAGNPSGPMRLTLIMYSGCLILLSVLAFNSGPEVPSPTLLWTCAGGLFCVSWGFVLGDGSSGRLATIVGAGLLTYDLFGSTIRIWMSLPNDHITSLFMPFLATLLLVASAALIGYALLARHKQMHCAPEGRQSKASSTDSYNPP